MLADSYSTAMMIYGSTKTFFNGLMRYKLICTGQLHGQKFMPLADGKRFIGHKPWLWMVNCHIKQFPILVKKKLGGSGVYSLEKLFISKTQARISYNVGTVAHVPSRDAARRVWGRRPMVIS